METRYRASSKDIGEASHCRIIWPPLPAFAVAAFLFEAAFFGMLEAPTCTVGGAIVGRFDDGDGVLPSSPASFTYDEDVEDVAVGCTLSARIWDATKKERPRQPVNSRSGWCTDAGISSIVNSSLRRGRGGGGEEHKRR